jgi:hypothetical protein
MQAKPIAPDLPDVSEDDDFTCAECASKELQEFSEVLDAGSILTVRAIRASFEEQLSDLPREWAIPVRAMLANLCFELPMKQSGEYDDLFCDGIRELAFPLWRKWHPINGKE